jgi:FxLD family lantipeptide
MSPTLLKHEQTTQATTTRPDPADPFALNVTLITDVPASSDAAPCNSNDGCGSTCPSACVSNS